MRITENSKRRNLEKSLLGMLKDQHIDTPANLEIVAEYMQLYDLKLLLLKDIQSNGASAEYKNGNNQSGIRANTNVQNLLKVNEQMLTLYNTIKSKCYDSRFSEPGGVM